MDEITLEEIVTGLDDLIAEENVEKKEQLLDRSKKFAKANKHRYPKMAKLAKKIHKAVKKGKVWQKIEKIRNKFETIQQRRRMNSAEAPPRPMQRFMQKQLGEMLSNTVLEMRRAKGQDPPIHPRIGCDGCHMMPIVGDRYKCAVCENFDFCDVCEAKAEHAHPFLKIRHPGQNPSALGIVLHEGGGGPLQVDAQLYADEEAKQQFGDPFLKSVPQMFKNTFESVFNKQEPLKAKFISHESLPDDSYLLPGSSVSKVWKVKNVGNMPWPAECTILLAKGQVEFSVVQPPALSPQEEGEVSVQITAPLEEGTHEATFRLAGGDMTPFGNKLHLRFKVLGREVFEGVQMLEDMGWTDRQANLELIQAYHGDVNQAIEQLLEAQLRQ